MLSHRDCRVYHNPNRLFTWFNLNITIKIKKFKEVFNGGLYFLPACTGTRSGKALRGIRKNLSPPAHVLNVFIIKKFGN
jgi:hypothetical protein